jgi:glutathione peroxidase
MWRKENLFVVIPFILSIAVLGCEENEENVPTDAEVPSQNQNAATGGIQQNTITGGLQNSNGGNSGSGASVTAMAGGAGGSQPGPHTPVAADSTAGTATAGFQTDQGGSAATLESGGTVGTAGTHTAGSTGDVAGSAAPPAQDADTNTDADSAECLGAYQFTVDSENTSQQSLCDYQGDVLLIVNIAANCGFTSQLEGLEQLHSNYYSQGFNVLGFWNNQFLSQMGDAARRSQVVAQFGVTFPLFVETNVNPPDEHPLFTWLKAESGGGNVGWNFEKFLVGRDGSFISRYLTATTPAQIAADIEAAL